MAAVVAVAVHWKPQLATTAVVCIAYRLLVDFGLVDVVEQVCTSPGTCVAGATVLLGLYGSWAAYTTGSSSSAPCKDKQQATGAIKSAAGCSTADVQKQQQAAGSQQQQTQADGTTSESAARPTMRLAEPPFSADLSVPALGSNNRHLLLSSCKPRRRRLPRLSIELTPLPRLSVDFCTHRQQAHSSSCSRASSLRRSLDRCSSLMPGAGPDMFSSSWGISEEAAAGSSGSSLVGCASLQLQQQLPTHAVGEATDSLGLGELAPGVGFLEDVINETHLLQVGAMLGEASARGALAAREAGGPVGHPTSFYGSADTQEHGEPWELLVSEGNDNVLYWGWRKPLRRGLYMYMTRSVFLGATPAELRAFMNDDPYRVVWDASMHVLRRVVSPDVPPAAAASSNSSSRGSSSGSNAAVELMAAAAAARMSGAGDGADSAGASGASASGGQHVVLPHESAVMQALVQFPKPMASRSYLYARRVWPRPVDGGCYCLSKGCTLPLSTPLPALPGRSVAVDDYCAGCVIRAPSPQLLPPGTDAAAPAAEVFMVYFEDSHVRPGLANLGIKKGLWPLVQRTDKALRVYQAGAAANSHLQAAPVVRPAHASTTADCSSSQQEEDEQEQHQCSSASSRPVVAGMSRSASLGSYELCGSPCSRGTQVLSRSASLQEPEHTRRLSSASLPCFPLGPELDDWEPAVQEPCSVCKCSCSIGGSADACGKPAQPAQEWQKKQQPQKSSRWGWLGRVGSTVCGVLKQSGQLLAAASVVLWRSGGSVSLLLPRFEWRVLNWAYQHVSGTRQLLLGAPGAAAGAAVSSSKLAPVSSHPLREWASNPGVVSTLTRQVVRRLPSHPITAEDLLAAAGDQQHPHGAITTMRSEPGLQLRLAYAAALGGSSSTAGSAVSSSAGSDVSSFSLSCSSCGCCCGGSSSGGSSRRCGRPHSGSGSLVRDETGGRRHRRVVVKLVQTAGMRVARRVARLAGITE